MSRDRSIFFSNNPSHCPVSLLAVKAHSDFKLYFLFVKFVIH